MLVEKTNVCKQQIISKDDYNLIDKDNWSVERDIKIFRKWFNSLISSLKNI